MELKSWSDVTKSKAYRSLSADERIAAKDQYPGIIIKSWTDVVNGEEYKGLTDKEKLKAKKQYIHEMSQEKVLSNLATSVNKNTSCMAKEMQCLSKQLKSIDVKVPDIKLPEVSLNTTNLSNILDDLAFQISQIKNDSQKQITDWDFEIIRDTDNSPIKRIKAHGY